MTEPILKLEHVSKNFKIKGKGVLNAVNDVSLFIHQGETLGLVGESGCGKTTLGRTILKLYKPDSGTITYQDKNIWTLNGQEKLRYTKDVQIIYQDPYASLDPLMVIGDSIAEGMDIHKLCTNADRTERTLLQKYPVLDARRVFVDGWLAAYLIFHTQRFRAAIQRPALINPTTAYGNCAAGWRKPFGNSLEEMLLSLAEHSVLTDVDACKTPCLILCREDEMRYSREQSEQLYAAIKDRDPDVTCRMAVFTARQWERHGMQEVVDWWKRFVREAEHEK